MSIRDAAASAVGDRNDIRARIRDLAHRARVEGEHQLEALKAVTGDVIEGVSDAVRHAMPHERKAVLRQVVDGLGDAYAAAADATREAMHEAKVRGEKLARGPVKKAVEELRTMEGDFIDSVKNAASTAGAGAKEEWKVLVTHAKAASRQMRPSVKAAMKAADGHLGDLASQTARTGAKAAGTLMGGLLSRAGGAMRRLGNEMQQNAGARGRKRSKTAKKTGKKRAGATKSRAGAKKPARRKRPSAK